jgi:glycosyltransferase involved in cell wall biosynthesis
MAAWSRAENMEGLTWFFNKVAPLIDFEATIVIIGKGLTKDYLRCNNPNIKIQLLGFVDNPYPEVSNCRAFLSPLFNGAGVKQKVFEALACGTPVIGNEIAFEGIDPKYSRFMLNFEDEKDFVKCMKEQFSLDERLTLKKNFSQDYHSKTIPQYIKEVID